MMECHHLSSLRLYVPVWAAARVTGWLLIAFEKIRVQTA